MRRVLSLIPAKYDDMWTAAKGFYKVEPVVADGGQVVLYAPHVREISRDAPGDRRDRLPLPRLLREAVGPLQGHPLGRPGPLHAPAWRRHLRRRCDGERLRVTVTLATGIPEEQVRAVNLDYLDPAEVDPDAWAADPDTLVVPRAGEVLFRLR